MKVKKFRLRPRLPTVGKILKAIMKVKQLPAGIEETLPQESENFNERVLPTAFYQTWSQDEAPAPFRPHLLAAGLNKCVAVSAVVATIGSALEDEMATLLINGETQRTQVLTAFAEDGADQSLQFILRLLADDAKGDECDISEPLMVVDPPLLAATLTQLEAQQENVILDQAQHLTPRFTRVAIVGWWPVSKRKRAAPPAKKKLA